MLLVPTFDATGVAIAADPTALLRRLPWLLQHCAKVIQAKSDQILCQDPISLSGCGDGVLVFGKKPQPGLN